VSSDCQVGKSWKVILFKCQVLFKPVFHFWTKLNPEDFFRFLLRSSFSFPFGRQTAWVWISLMGLFLLQIRVEDD
jgi:hypothetical protein